MTSVLVHQCSHWYVILVDWRRLERKSAPRPGWFNKIMSWWVAWQQWLLPPRSCITVRCCHRANKAKINKNISSGPIVRYRVFRMSEVWRRMNFTAALGCFFNIAADTNIFVLATSYVIFDLFRNTFSQECPSLFRHGVPLPAKQDTNFRHWQANQSYKVPALRAGPMTEKGRETSGLGRGLRLTVRPERAPPQHV